jgi:hypothetical protein
MERFRLFYSWQADRPGELCRHFIDIALKAAGAAVSEAIGVDVEIDSDTQGEPGTPPITDTILRKIRECDAFVADMTFVAETSAGKLLPNPNVMGEYGYALSEKSTRRILLAMNTAFGPPEKLPFDLGHLRHPLTFELAEGAPDRARRSARDAFARKLFEPIKLLVERARAERVVEEAGEPAAAAAARGMVQTLMNSTELGTAPAVVSRPKMVLNLAPFAPFAGRRLDIREARRVMAGLTPAHLAASDTGLDESEWWVRGKGMIIPGRPNPETSWYVRLIRPGVFEVALNIGQKIDDDPRALVDGLKVEAAVVDMFDRCAAAAVELGFSGPALATAALIGAEDVDVNMGRLSGRFRKPAVALEQIEIADIAERIGNYLQPMFDHLWTAAGISAGSISYSAGEWAGYRGERPYEL